jgi:DivIVA domain-containing protein
MALDRQSIEKRDFPIGRRGYEPEAVDAHLAQLAEEVEELQRRAAASASASPSSAPTPRSSPASIAQAASEQVRAIVEAAESSAADIERAAQEEAVRIRDDAESGARHTRDEAVGQSQQHVGQVRQATTQMLQRVDAMEGELTALVESLRTGSNRLTADLSLLEGNMGDLYDASGRDRPAGRPVVESVPAVVASEPPAADPVAPEPPAAFADEDDDLDDLAEGFVADEPVVLPAAAEPEGAVGADVEGARLVALNMALNGTARDETARYLAENFDLVDREGLLDEVYATIEP